DRLRGAARPPVRHSARRIRGSRVPGLEERRRHQLCADRNRRRPSRLPRFLERRRPAARQGRAVYVERREVPDDCGVREECWRRFRASAHDQARAAGPRHRVSQLPPRRQQPLQPRVRRLGRPHLGRAHRQPRQLHAVDGLPSRWPPRSRDRDALAAAPGRAVRARHTAALARRRAQREQAALRADQQLRERARARRVDSVTAPVSRSYVDVPEGWTRVATRRVLGFVTGETFRAPDGTTVVWRSRPHRKRGRGPIQGSTVWAPHALAWWIGVLFMIGSACFVLGPLPGYLSWVGYRADAATFFIGSIFFTSAAFCQYVEAAVAPRSLTGTGPHRLRRRAAIEV